MITLGKAFKARASLIDRLIDDKPIAKREARPLRSHSMEELKASVRRDLMWLLNTRTPLSATEFDEKEELTTLDYGIPDFGTYYTANGDDRVDLLRRLRKAIAAFEPRLKGLRVEVKPRQRDERSLSIYFDADIVVEEVRIPVSFRTIYQSTQGDWNLNDGES